MTQLDDHDLAENMKNELKSWFGDQVNAWKMLNAYRINYGLPKLQDMNNETSPEQFKISENLYICGDHLLNGSINATMGSGRMVANLIEKQFNK